jgi:hypothetical protein
MDALQTAPMRSRVESIAYSIWERRGKGVSVPESMKEDYLTALKAVNDDSFARQLDACKTPEELEWFIWAGRILRRYITIDAAADPDALTRLLLMLESGTGPSVKPTARLLVVLDGSPEYSRAAFIKHRNNGTPAEQVIERKDQAFYRRCLTSVTNFGGTLLGQQRPSLTSYGQFQDRAFQDGAAAVFFGDSGLVSAIAATVRLMATLSDYNLYHASNWCEELHARVSIGYNWDQSVLCLQDTCRDEVEFASDAYAALPPDLQTVLRAAGVKPGILPTTRRAECADDGSDFISQYFHS